MGGKEKVFQLLEADAARVVLIDASVEQLEALFGVGHIHSAQQDAQLGLVDVARAVAVHLVEQTQHQRLQLRRGGFYHAQRVEFLVQVMQNFDAQGIDQFLGSMDFSSTSAKTSWLTFFTASSRDAVSATMPRMGKMMINGIIIMRFTI